ncbi:MAG TPA: hypothetical protein VLQ48_01065 [Chloroflexia bacterium]|nr:hypothetical protein [Chloroflexia bacterium]
MTVEVLISTPTFSTIPTTAINVFVNIRIDFDITFTDSGATRTRQGRVEGETNLRIINY